MARARELLGIGHGGLALCGSTYEDSGIAGAAVFAVLAPEAPEGRFRSLPASQMHPCGLRDTAMR